MDLKNFDFKKFMQSEAFRKILYILGIAFAVLVIFQAGMLVGYRKAAFSYRWGDNFYRSFGRPERGFSPDMPGGNGRSFMMGAPRAEFLNPHGAAGKIIKIDLPQLMIEDLDRVEKAVLIKDDTQIMRFREAIKPADLKINDSVVVIGSPDEDAWIHARLIRVMPVPVESFAATTTKAQ